MILEEGFRSDEGNGEMSRGEDSRGESRLFSYAVASPDVMWRDMMLFNFKPWFG